LPQLFIPTEVRPKPTEIAICEFSTLLDCIRILTRNYRINHMDQCITK